MVKVHNLTNNNGIAVANQFEIRDGHNTYFQSYDTIIAKYDNKGLILDKHAMDYSDTTSKHLYRWTNSNRKDLTAGIKDGTIRVQDLNKD